jgi:hypothetical protein
MTPIILGILNHIGQTEPTSRAANVKPSICKYDKASTAHRFCKTRAQKRSVITKTETQLLARSPCRTEILFTYSVELYSFRHFRVCLEEVGMNNLFHTGLATSDPDPMLTACVSVRNTRLASIGIILPLRAA